MNKKSILVLVMTIITLFSATVCFAKTSGKISEPCFITVDRVAPSKSVSVKISITDNNGREHWLFNPKSKAYMTIVDTYGNNIVNHVLVTGSKTIKLKLVGANYRVIFEPFYGNADPGVYNSAKWKVSKDHIK